RKRVPAERLSMRKIKEVLRLKFAQILKMTMRRVFCAAITHSSLARASGCITAGAPSGRSQTGELFMSQLVQQLTGNFVVVAVAPIGCLMLALVLITPTARASEWDLTTKFTVSHPFEVPRLTLQPNTRYTIRLYDSPNTRNVVQA